MAVQANYLDDKFAGTYQKLFDTIERGVDQCSTDLLQTLLEEKSNSLSLGLKAFNEPSSQSRLKLKVGTNISIEGKTIVLNKEEVELVQTLSIFLDLNELQCALLWNAYRQENDNDLESAKMIYGYQMCEDTELILRFTIYYFQDRIAILQCVTSLIRISREPSHPYTQIAKNTVQAINVHAEFADRMISQLKTLVRFDVPSQFFANPLWAATRARQNLKEEIAILEMLFIIHAFEPCPPKRVFTIIQEFEANCFGIHQTCGRLLSHQDADLFNRLSFMCELVAVQVLGLERLAIEIIGDGQAGQEKTLLQSPEIIIDINSVVAFLGNSASHSTFMLAWSYFLCCLNSKLATSNGALGAYEDVQKLFKGTLTVTPAKLLPSPPLVDGANYEDLTRKKPIINQTADVFGLYASRSIRLNVFDHITEILQSVVCSEENPNKTTCRNTLRILINSILSWTRPCFLPSKSYPSLIKCTQLLFENEAELCAKFWKQDFVPNDPLSLIATARKRFPVRFLDFTQLMSSLTGSAENIEISKESAKNVFDYLTILPTMAVNIKQSAHVLVHKEGRSTIITAQKPVIILREGSFVNELIIPSGTKGKLLGESNGHGLVRWKFNYSGWSFLVALLGKLIREEHGVDQTTDIVDFGGHDGLGRFEMIYSILELIRKVMGSNPSLTSALVQHVEKACQRSSKFNAPNSPSILITTICSTFAYCSVIGASCPTYITTSALRCLTLLLPAYRNDIWTFLESSPVLSFSNSPNHTTSYFKTPYSVWNDPATKIQELVSKVECDVGRYPLLLAFLDFVLALVNDIQRSWWITNDASQSSTKIKTPRQYQAESLFGCLYYLTQKVFPSYAGWRYQSLSERYLIGAKVLSIFIHVEQYFKEADATPESEVSLGRLRDGLLTNFLYEGGEYQISPLLDIISDGATIADHLYRTSCLKEARQAEKLAELGLGFVKVLLKHHFSLVQAKGVPRESMLEKLMLARKTDANMPNFLLSIMKHIHYRHNITLPILSTNVASLLFRSLSTWKTVPPLVQHFGTADQAKDIIKCYLEIAKDHFQNERLLASIWQMIGLLLESQPTLGVLFLECGEYIMPSPKSAVKMSTGDEKNGRLHTGNESAVRSAVDILTHWQMLAVEKPTVLSNVLRFLATFWETASDHRLLLQRIRSDNALWHALGQIILNKGDIKKQPTTPIELRKVQSALDSELDPSHIPSMSNHSRAIRRLCCIRLGKAFALRIMTLEIHLTARSNYPRCNVTNSKTIDTLPAGLKNLIIKISEVNTLTLIQKSFTKSSFDPALSSIVRQDNADLLHFIGVTDVSQLLTSVGKVGFGDDDTDGEGRQYGDSYLYDLKLAEARIESLYKTVVPPIPQANLALNGPHKSAQDDIIKKSTKKFLLDICLANHNWSLVDSELILLRSFKIFIETCSCHVSDLFWSTKISTARTMTLFEFVVSLVNQAIAEKRDTNIALTAYSVIINFIRAMTEDWVDSNRSVLVETNEAAKKTYVENMFTLVVKLCRLLQQENYALKTNLDGLTATTFHRPLLEAILLCMRTLRSSRGIVKNITLSERTKNSLVEPMNELMEITCESFQMIVTKAMTVGATATKKDDGSSEELIKNFNVVIALLEELVNGPYSSHSDVWLAIFSRYDTFPTLLRLVYGGIEVVVNEIESQVKPGSEANTILISPYAQSGLYLLLTLTKTAEATEELVKAGLFELLCNNALTQRLQNNGIDVFIRFDGQDGKPGCLEHSPLHNIWCLMLGVVRDVLQTSKGADSILRAAAGFMQVYKVQTGRAFSNANNDEGSMIVLGPTESLSSPVLEEIERISMVMFSLSKYGDRVKDYAANLFIAYKDCSLTLVQSYLYFYTHPAHMQAQLFPMNKRETELAQTFTFAREHVSASEPKTSLLMYLCVQKIARILRNIFLSLNILTKVNVTLNRPSAEWSFGDLILTPYMHVVLGESASFGTVLECINAGLRMVKQWKSQGWLVEGDPAFSPEVANKTMMDVVQACAYLLTTQVMLSGKKPGLSAYSRDEIESTVLPCVNEALSRVRERCTKRTVL
ncbi:nucleoporin subcomplex protein binding to Pom34-domain-containing protein [Phycomyces nitens]|nr:nucleoporin subcomplex protein binding to Pom34-domain-containing protein [Phycomyces nitens]